MVANKVLLLGACGFIGKNIIDFLIKADFEVHALDKKGASFDVGVEVRQISVPITETAKIKEYIERESISIVIHLISGLLPSSASAEFHREMADVVIPTFHLIDALNGLNVKFVYFSSGGTVYGQNVQSTLNEDTQCCPTSYYGYSKTIIEEYLKLANRRTGFPYLILRPSNPYGRHQNPQRKQGFIAVALDKVIKDESIEIWGDGLTVRDYIYIDDLCHALVELLLKNVVNMTINIGSGVGHSLLDVIKMIAHVSGKKTDIIFKETRSTDIAKVILDVGKLNRLISFTPKTTQDGIESFYAFLKNKRD